MSGLTPQERRALARSREARRAVAERLGRNWTERIKREEKAAAQNRPSKVASRAAVGVGSLLAIAAVAQFLGLGKLHAAQLSLAALAVPYAGAVIRMAIGKSRANRSRIVYEDPPRRVRRHTT